VLHLCCFSSQRVEAVEREDENASLKPKLVKGGKKVKPVKMEVLPSPSGRRVEPKFDSIKKKAEGAKKTKVYTRIYIDIQM